MNKSEPQKQSFPATRMRRPRLQDWGRRLVRETKLDVDNLIWPLFVREGDGAPEPVEALPGVNRLSIADAVDHARQARDLGIPAIALFPRIDADDKDEDGTKATDDNNLVCRCVAAVREAVPEIGLITDIALDPFTTHGHDGIIRDGQVANDETVEILVRQAIVQARAGATIIAPSDMMDGRVQAIRQGLDAEGFSDVMIMSYAAKYASCFYGPFRNAVGAGKTAAAIGKDTYQMDPANTDEAMREIAIDIAEGADLIIIKPGMPYLDIIQRATARFEIPVIAYQVSGEYAMIEAAAAAGHLDRDRAIMETLTGFRRAGADAIMTYHAAEVAAKLQG